MKNITTRLNFGNDRYPCLMINWKEHDMGYDGVCSVWEDGDKKLCEHKISISRGSPIGHLFIDLDNVGSGCWAMARLSADTINERDLQWATAWAIQAIERKHNVWKCEQKIST